AVLQFLLSVSDQTEGQDSRENPIENAFSVMGLKSIKAAPEFRQLPQTFSSASPAAEFNPNEADMGSLKNPRGPCNGYYLLGGKEGNIKVTEPLLLRDILFIFQDIDGKFIKFNPTADVYVIIENVWIPPSTLENISRLSEVGWLYRRIKQIVSGWKNDDNEGLVRQGFCVGIEKELIRHFELIAQLEDQFQKVDLTGNDDYASKGLSLKRLLVWVNEPLQKLRLISVLLDLSAGLRGGALLSMIHGYTNHGDPFVQNFVEGLLKEVDVFVAKKSYLIGKSLNFIRYCCGEESFVIQRSQELVSSSPGFLAYGDSTLLEKSINAAYTSISAHILDLLFGKYKLMTHLQALKKYLLLGQGDFVQNLMDKLGSDLSKPAQSILRHNLTGILESSIRASNAQHDDTDVLRRLDVRLLEISSGDSGWDVFTLDYHTDSPISTVFPSQSMHQYMKLFTFLWRLKRVEHTLSAAWKKGMTEYTVFRKVKDIGQHFHFSSIVQSEMIHFTYQLQYYILFEVLECSWNELNTYLEKRTGDLDQLIGAHNKYLNNITSRGLLAATTSSNQNMFSMLIGLFDVILKFQLAMEEMVEIGLEVLSVAKQNETKEYESRLMNRISTIHDVRLDVSKKPMESLSVRIETVGANIKQIAEEYHVRVTSHFVFCEHLKTTIDRSSNTVECIVEPS
ncbi:UNVERIFIED_CONTAM: Gamma-tubulin complex component 3, partial [Siphonaria sp. JEL0065]